MIPDPNTQEYIQNLTGSAAAQDNDPVSEEADRLRNEPQRHANEPLSNENNVIRLKNNPDFVSFVENNLWETRRDRGFPWKMNVFDYIETVYEPWHDKGILQSDLRALDPKLYAQLHKSLSAIADLDERGATLERLQLKKESDARYEAITDPARRQQQDSMREWWREQNALRRQKKPENHLT
jgi:hypothetical protein